MPAGDDQRVAAGRRVDVHERDGALVLGDDLAGQLAGDDLAEDAVGIAHRARGRPIRRPRPSSCRARAIASSARVDLAGEGGLLQLGSSSPDPRPGRIPIARASSSPRTGGRGGAARQASPAPSSWRASSRWPAIARSALSPARGQPVGDAQHGDVDRDRRARVQVPVDRAAGQRHLVHEEAEPQVMARQRRDVLGQPLAGPQPPRIVRPSCAPASSWPMKVTRPCARHVAGSGAWRCRETARRSAAPARGSARRPAARPAARPPPSPSDPNSAPGSRSRAIGSAEHRAGVAGDVEVVKAALLDPLQRARAPAGRPAVAPSASISVEAGQRPVAADQPPQLGEHALGRDGGQRRGAGPRQARPCRARPRSPARPRAGPGAASAAGRR